MVKCSSTSCGREHNDLKKNGEPAETCQKCRDAVAKNYMKQKEAAKKELEKVKLMDENGLVGCIGCSERFEPNEIPDAVKFQNEAGFCTGCLISHRKPTDNEKLEQDLVELLDVHLLRERLKVVEQENWKFIQSDQKGYCGCDVCTDHLKPNDDIVFRWLPGQERSFDMEYAALHSESERQAERLKGRFLKRSCRQIMIARRIREKYEKKNYAEKAVDDLFERVLDEHKKFIKEVQNDRCGCGGVGCSGDTLTDGWTDVFHHFYGEKSFSMEFALGRSLKAREEERNKGRFVKVSCHRKLVKENLLAKMKEQQNELNPPPAKKMKLQ